MCDVDSLLLKLIFVSTSCVFSS